MPRSRTAPFALAVVAAALLALAPGAFAAGKHDKRHATKSAAARSFTGTVASVAPRRKSLSLKTKRGATVRVSVTRATKGARLRGLKRGQAITVRATRGKGGWVAARIAKRATPAAEDDQGSDDTDQGIDDESDDLGDDPADDQDTPVDGDITQDGFPSDDATDPSDS